jgi:hypothetical protein
MVDTPKEIYVSDHSLARPGDRCAARNCESATYEETLQVLEDRFVNEHFAAGYCSQLKMKMQKV